jgi:hypothetical protein
VGAEVLENTLGRKVLGMSIGDTLGNEVICISLGYVEGESLGFSVGR